MGLDERLSEANETMDDFISGAQVLQKLAGWAYIIANQREALEQLLLFEKAYEKLVKLHEEGKLDAGTIDVSRENLERARRLCDLIRPGLDKEEVSKAAPEIQQIAEQCSRALASQRQEA